MKKILIGGLGVLLLALGLAGIILDFIPVMISMVLIMNGAAVCAFMVKRFLFK